MKNFSENNSLILLKMAAKKLGVSEDELRAAIQSGDFKGIGNVDTSKINELLSDEEKRNKLISSPQVQEIIKKFSKGG